MWAVEGPTSTPEVPSHVHQPPLLLISSWCVYTRVNDMIQFCTQV
jgi:hypothetical protein